MKKLFLPLVLAATLFISACGNKVIMDESHTLPNNTWQRFTTENFNLDISNTDDCYDLYVSVTADTAQLKDNAIPIIVAINSPSNEHRTIFSTIILKGKNGKWLATPDANGNITCSQRVRDYFFFNDKGTHAVEISQRSHRYELSGVKQLNFRVVKAEMELPH